MAQVQKWRLAQRMLPMILNAIQRQDADNVAAESETYRNLGEIQGLQNQYRVDNCSPIHFRKLQAR